MLCTDASPVHPVLKDLLPGADVITPMVCTDASPVQPVMKTWLLRDLHRLWNTVRPMHRCPFLTHRFILGAANALAQCMLHQWYAPNPRRGGPSGQLRLSSLYLCHHLNL